jgi:calcineurin-like phosphoesterase family protein
MSLLSLLKPAKYWVVSDTHFYHEKVKEYCGRPDNHEKLILDALKTIPEKDILIHLGDVSWAQEKRFNEEVLSGIKCRKILVKGNHDRMSSMFYMNNGWDFCCESFKLDFMNKNIIFSHKPAFWDGTWEINIHGHFHNNLHRSYEQGNAPDFCKLISMEYLNYKPIHLERVLSKKSPLYK